MTSDELFAYIKSSGVPGHAIADCLEALVKLVEIEQNVILHREQLEAHMRAAHQTPARGFDLGGNDIPN